MSRYRRRLMMASQEKEEYIVFADPAVEAICVANWSSDGIGLTYEDAAAVTKSQFGTTFRGNTQITSFDELQYFTGLGELPLNALRDCSALASIVLPDNLTTIGSQAFLNDTALSGTVIVPATVTSIEVSAFTPCTGITNLIILARQDFSLALASGNSGIGNGSGLFYHKGSIISVPSSYYYHFRDIAIEGSVENTGTIRAIFYGDDVLTVRVGGNVTINTNGFVQSSMIKFIEVGGNIISTGNYFAQYGSGVILHLGKTSGTACSPSVLGSNLSSTYSKIYVGDGSSQAADQAVLAQYLADPDWAQYSSKLDLWYNYNGEYKNWPTIPTS